MTGADTIHLDFYEEDVEQRYLTMLARMKAAHDEEVKDLAAQVALMEEYLLRLLPYCVEAFSLLSAVDEGMGDLSTKGPTAALILQTNIREWLKEFHKHVKERAEPDGQDDSSGTDLEA